ncbi:MAG: hypothetical protein P8R42_09115 [Candidatus Binatia bacterium]|nr:hypothetical protein [Candidatus Binatia bacterium]
MTSGYGRRADGGGAPGADAAWGIDNKESAIRVLQNPFGEGPTHFERRMLLEGC